MPLAQPGRSAGVVRELTFIKFDVSEGWVLGLGVALPACGASCAQITHPATLV